MANSALVAYSDMVKLLSDNVKWENGILLSNIIPQYSVGSWNVQEFVQVGEVGCLWDQPC